MSAIGSHVTRLFGNSGTLADGSAINQLVPETVPVGTTARRFQGPREGGAWSAHVMTITAAGATSAMTFGYSNLPNPDPAVDSQWEDSGITAVDIATVGSRVVRPALPVVCAWVRARAVVATSVGAVVVYVKSEGVS